MGIKPLYYAIVEGALFFASEVRALLASGAVPVRLSSDALSSYLLFGYVSEPVTLVEGVFSLPPGHYLDVQAGEEKIRSVTPRAYWNRAKESARETAVGTAAGAAETPAARVRSLLEQAVASHLIADVPVGVFLSSGIDSTAIATIASRAQKGIHTFTVAFPEAEFSEAEMARRTAKALARIIRSFDFRAGDGLPARRGHCYFRSANDGWREHVLCLLGSQAGGIESGAFRTRKRRTLRRLCHFSARRLASPV